MSKSQNVLVLNTNKKADLDFQLVSSQSEEGYFPRG
jgi:hypothetical protein